MTADVSERPTATTPRPDRAQYGLAALLLVVGAYLAAAVGGLVRERLGLTACGCSAACWCRRPGVSLFRWVFPFRHG